MQGSEGLILTTPSLLSISFEECTRFINPTQTGAPPPLSQTNTLCSRHNKHPETKSSWRKDPWTQRSCAGRRAQKGLCDGRGTIRPETKAPVFMGRDSRDSLAGQQAAHTASFSHLQLEAPTYEGSSRLPSEKCNASRDGNFSTATQMAAGATPDLRTHFTCQSWRPSPHCSSHFLTRGLPTAKIRHL